MTHGGMAQPVCIICGGGYDGIQYATQSLLQSPRWPRIVFHSIVCLDAMREVVKAEGWPANPLLWELGLSDKPHGYDEADRDRDPRIEGWRSPKSEMKRQAILREIRNARTSDQFPQAPNPGSASTGDSIGVLERESGSPSCLDYWTSIGIGGSEEY